MKLRNPVVLLFLWLIFPVGLGHSRFLVAQVLLCQIRAIHVARQAEKKLDLDSNNNTDKALRKFLLSFWFDPGNTTAYAYLGLLAPDLGLFSHPIIEIRRKVASNKFEFSKHSVNQSIMNQIGTNEIKEVIANGELIEEYSEAEYNSNYIIYGFTQTKRLIHIKCRHQQLVKIIAVYEPNPKQ